MIWRRIAGRGRTRPRDSKPGSDWIRIIKVDSQSEASSLVLSKDGCGFSQNHQHGGRHAAGEDLRSQCSNMVVSHTISSGFDLTPRNLLLPNRPVLIIFQQVIRDFHFDFPASGSIHLSASFGGVETERPITKILRGDNKGEQLPNPLEVVDVIIEAADLARSEHYR